VRFGERQPRLECSNLVRTSRDSRNFIRAIRIHIGGCDSERDSLSEIAASMTDNNLHPLVSIITPVYNGAAHLADCVESVLRQTYPHWDYTIVDNCSTDETLAVAQKYAARDPRIRVLHNEQFLRIIENHNLTIRQISPQSKYCKFVFADDWLYPTCVEEMVRVAEGNPSVGLVGAFTMDGKSVLTSSPVLRGTVWQPGPPPSCVVTGRELCRSELFGNGGYVLGTMTSLLVRSDLIRKRTTFFNEPHLHADHESCFEVLKDSDFGFCQQVLSYTRPRPDSTSSFAEKFDVIPLGKLALFLKYGSELLNETERRTVLAKRRGEYYQALAHNMLRLRQASYWKYHRDTLLAYGYHISPALLTLALIHEIVTHLLHPANALRRTWHWWSQAIERISRRQPFDRQRAP
jgi:glycosyltransferase involved in cell wall biosynthesis